MVKTCPECCACNNNDAVFCSSCGVQLVVAPPVPPIVVTAPPPQFVVPPPAPPLVVAPPVPWEWTQRIEGLRRDVGQLSSRNQFLEEQLKRTMDEMRNQTGQIRADEQSLRMDLERQLSERNRVLEGELGRAVAEMRSLTTQVKADEDVHRKESGRMAELVDANRKLAEQVSRTSIRPRFCDKCGRRLVPTGNANVLSCPVCCVTYPPVTYSAPAQPYYWPATSPAQEYASGPDYSHPGGTHAGRSWHGIYIHENCGFCGQQLQTTSDPNVVYCPYCQRYQPHVHK